MASIISPNDVLVAIGHNLPQGRKCFKDDRQRLHEFFYHRKIEFPITINGFIFRWDDNYPKSPELDDAISTLAQTGLLKFCLTDPGHYQFDEQVKDSYEKFVVKRIFQQQARQLTLIAADFDRQFGEVNRYN